MVLRATLLAMLAALSASCLSPTLPLPPPDEPTTMGPSTEDPDVWIISGSCPDGSVVIVTNQETGAGDAYQDLDMGDGTCSYSLRLEAQRCDRAKVRVVSGDDAAETDFVVQERQNGTNTDMSACK